MYLFLFFQNFLAFLEATKRQFLDVSAFSSYSNASSQNKWANGEITFSTVFGSALAQTLRHRLHFILSGLPTRFPAHLLGELVGQCEAALDR
jgi:hypothetical protein